MPDGAGDAVALVCGAAVGVPAVTLDGTGVVVGAAALGGGETSEDVQPATTNRQSAIAANARRTGSR